VAVDATTVTTWLEGLGLQTSRRALATGEEVWFGAASGAEPPNAIRWRTPTVMDVYHVRHVPAAALTAQWRDPSNNATPSAVLRDSVRQVAQQFPLVDGSVAEENGSAVVYFSAPLFDEPLTRQAFALTVSSVLKAAATFEAGSNIRAAQLAALDRARMEPAVPQGWNGPRG
jgi:hypothetical protein